MPLKDVVNNMDIKEFHEQKEWLAKIASEDSKASCAQGLLHLLESIQDAVKEELRYNLPETREVTQICPNCDRVVTLVWNIRENGLKAFCPHCGRRLMLCSSCPATEGKSFCDYNDLTEGCRYNDEIMNKTNTTIHYLYQDTSNFKKFNRVIIPGLMTEGQTKRIWDSLFDGGYFIPHIVGMPEERYYGTKDNHSYFKLLRIEETSDSPDLIVKAEELVEKFERNKDHWEISL